MPDARSSDEYKAYKAKYCVDDAFMAAAAKRHAEVGPEKQAFYELRLDYILKTGANWSGPIKEFRLVADKGVADSLISFCGEGVKKIAPTQFEMQKRDYAPNGNFSLLILKRMPPQ